MENQSFHSLFEIMETEILNVLFGQQGVGLLFENRDFLRQRRVVILAFNDEIIPQLVGDSLRLTKMAAAIRAGIDLDKSDYVGINGGYETDYPLQID